MFWMEAWQPVYDAAVFIFVVLVIAFEEAEMSLFRTSTVNKEVRATRWGHFSD